MSVEEQPPPGDLEAAAREAALARQRQEEQAQRDRVRYWATTDVMVRGHSPLQAAVTWGLTKDQVQKWLDEDAEAGIDRAADGPPGRPAQDG